MARIIGEARYDQIVDKWYFVIYVENGDVIFESDHVFDTQEEAEELLIKALRGLAGEFPPEAGPGPGSKPPKP